MTHSRVFASLLVDSDTPAEVVTYESKVGIGQALTGTGIYVSLAGLTIQASHRCTPEQFVEWWRAVGDQVAAVVAKIAVEEPPAELSASGDVG